jgi:hypothetical protein
MASTLVHVALAALLAAALLGRALDWRAALVVLAATAFIDLDSFVGLILDGTHRAAFHTFLLPAVAAVLIYYDTRVRDASAIARWRPDGARVAAVAVLAVAVAGIGLDMVINGVNAFWPLHDQFYTVDGKALLSDQRGVVQTFVEIDPPEPQGDGQVTRTTNNTHYSTGVDPAKGEEPEDVERIFPLVRSGWQLLLVVVGYGVLAVRLWEVRGE